MRPNERFLHPQLLQTADGSVTLYHAAVDETYHSKHGAIQESRHVFIKTGFDDYIAKNPSAQTINILEVGLGTGLNALLTYIESKKTGATINYVALEAYPPPTEITEKLNYPDLYTDKHTQSIFREIHICTWEKILSFSPNFNFRKNQITLQEFTTDILFDLVYFDAFAPQVQPELWTKEIFNKLYKQMRKNALLVTYCAKGEVRRNMQAAGFKVERLAGPPGKREIL
ncbi:MAG: tRNA (5-methylaminomethyl-2-thiouridine)(34)-methyltransferase MnmD, partial [Bacteroidia bacterium]